MPEPKKHVKLIKHVGGVITDTLIGKIVTVAIAGGVAAVGGTVISHNMNTPSKPSSSISSQDTVDTQTSKAAYYENDAGGSSAYHTETRSATQNNTASYSGASSAAQQAANNTLSNTHADSDTMRSSANSSQSDSSSVSSAENTSSASSSPASNTASS